MRILPLRLLDEMRAELRTLSKTPPDPRPSPDAYASWTFWRRRGTRRPRGRTMVRGSASGAGELRAGPGGSFCRAAGTGRLVAQPRVHFA